MRLTPPLQEHIFCLQNFQILRNFKLVQTSIWQRPVPCHTAVALYNRPMISRVYTSLATMDAQAMLLLPSTPSLRPTTTFRGFLPLTPTPRSCRLALPTQGQPRRHQPCCHGCPRHAAAVQHVQPGNTRSTPILANMYLQATRLLPSTLPWRPTPHGCWPTRPA